VPEYLLLMSGTLAKNEVYDLYQPYTLVSMNPKGTSGLDMRKMIPTFKAFKDFFCNKYKTELWSGKVVTNYSGVRNEHVLNQIRRDKRIRRLTSEVLDLPEQVNIDVPVSLKEDKVLEGAWNRYLAGESETDDHISTIKMNNAVEKVPFTVKYIKGLTDEGESVIVFSDHRHSAQLIHEAIKGSALIMGGASDKKRANIIKEFQAGNIKVLIGTIGAVSTGVTVTASANMVFNDLSWSHTDLEQAMKRIHRYGQMRVCVYHYVLGSATDDRIVRRIRSKVKTAEKVELGDGLDLL